jgi:NADH-quinone oxidoreductase subunit F
MKRDHWLLPEAPYASYDAYLRENGPSAVVTARGMDADAVLERVARSGLRGRGGAGFPTGVKWRTLRTHECPTRFVVCNAAEGEPGTFKDRWLLRLNPYATLEGLLIAAHVIGAREIYVGIRASFRKEIERLRAAIDEMSGAGVVGGLKIHVYEGPEEYLFGEEKALLNAIEMGEPLPREVHYPPYELGLFATPFSPNPALVNNAETYAHVPSIVRLGPESFRKLGTSDTPGTVIFTLSGDIQRPGIYEREAGVSLRDLLHDVAGGPRPGRKLKVVISGVATGAIRADKLDTHADFGSLALIGSGLGSAGFVAYDDTRWTPRIAQMVARFLYVESCNQCTACKLGLQTSSTAIDEMFDPARATADDLESAVFGARSAPQGNRCYLPQQGAILIPSLVDQFRDEFVAQIAHPTRESERIPIPLIEDYDPVARTFLYDASIERKQPDWTYEPPVPAKARPTKPSRTPSGAAGVRLTGEVLAKLRELAEREGVDLDRIVNRLLRESLKLDRKR